MEIRNCIAELLSEHDCVIIPGFGGFIGNYTPARIDPVNHTFHPPSKQLLFNVNLRHNDGLLATRISTTLSISYHDASRIAEGFSDECIQVLNSGESLQFPRIGRLFAGNEGNIQFEQHKTSNLLTDSFGLGTFISPPVSQTASRGNLRRKKAVTINTVKRGFRIPKIFRWAAVLAIPIAIAGVIGVMQYDKISTRYANNAGILSSVFSRFSSASLFEKKSVPSGIKPIATTSQGDSKTVDPPVEEQTGKEIVAETASAAVVETVNSGDRFAVIIGAFKLEENAEKLILELQAKGIGASVYDQSRSGLYRVTMGTFSNRKEALQLLASAQSTGFQGAWLLAK